MRLWTAWCWAFVFVGLVAGSAHAQDSWLGADKATHFGVSAVVATGGYAASMLVVEEPWQRAALGGGFAFGLGIAKEIYDATGQGDPSLRDLTWDVIGCAFGVSVSLLVDYALRSPRKPEPQTVFKDSAHKQMRAAAW
jgi:putative lipoprotein